MGEAYAVKYLTRIRLWRCSIRDVRLYPRLTNHVVLLLSRNLCGPIRMRLLPHPVYAIYFS